MVTSYTKLLFTYLNNEIIYEIHIHFLTDSRSRHKLVHMFLISFKSFDKFVGAKLQNVYAVYLRSSQRMHFFH